MSHFNRQVVSISLVTLLVCVSIRTSARAQDGSVDDTFTATPQTESIARIQPQSDGRVLYTFLNANGALSIARLNADGTKDLTFTIGQGAEAYSAGVPGVVPPSTNPASILAAAGSEGRVLVGGDFNRFDNASRGGFARLNADGSLDAGFAPVGAAGPGALVDVILPRSNGKVYVAGRFDTFNGVARNLPLVRLNADGTIDPSFGDLAAKTTGRVYELSVAADGRLTVLHTTTAGAIGFQIIRLNADGTADSSFQLGNGTGSFGGAAMTHALLADGRILVDGGTGTYNGSPAGPIVFRLNANGTIDTTYSSPQTKFFTTTIPPSRIVALPNGAHYISGGFSTVNGTARPGVARLNADGTLDTTFEPPSPPVSGRQVAVQSNGKVLTVGFVGDRNAIIRLNVSSAPAGAPEITDQPDSLTVPAGQSATFTVVASGEATYRWQKNGQNLSNDGRVSGATSATLTIANVAQADAGVYTVIVSSATGSTPSAAASLSIAVAPEITVQPQSQSVSVGANVTLVVTAAGTPPLSYQWKKGGADISGATDATLTLNNVQTGDAGSYTVSVSNAAGTTLSEPATVTVATVLQPPVITQHPLNQSVNVGESVTFTVQVTGRQPFTYQWRKNGEGIPGATSASLTLNNVQESDATGYSVVIANADGSVGSNTATLTVNAVVATAPQVTQNPQSQSVNAGANATFTVQATGSAPLMYHWRKNGEPISGATSATLSLNGVQSADAGDYSVVVSNSAGSATSSAATLTVNAVSTGPQITQQPLNSRVTVGATAVFSVSANGTAPLTYQWRKDGTNIAGATGASLTIANAQASSAGSYSVVVSDSAGTVTSTSATLTVEPVTDRRLEITDVHMNNEGKAVATVRLAAQGNENAVAFTITFDPQVFSNPQIALILQVAPAQRAQLASVPQGTTLSTDTSAAAQGRVGVTVTLPQGATLSAGQQDLVTAQFDIAPGSTSNQGQLAFAAASASDTSGNALAAQTSVAPTTSPGPAPTAPNRQTGLFEQFVTIGNPGNVTITNISLAIRGLTNDSLNNPIRVFNAHYHLQGVPFIDFGPIPAGGSVDLRIEFYVSDRSTVPTPEYQTLVLPAFSVPIPSTVQLQLKVDPKRIEGGFFFAEFPTDAGRIYYVQYNSSLSDTNGWKTSLPHIRGTGSRVQWTDNGPPRTESIPQNATNRFYRILVAQ